MRRILGRRRRPERVTFVTRTGCHLCELALPVVERAVRDAGLVLEVRDVDADPADVAAYGENVPVVLLDGREHARWRVDERALRRALRG